MKFYRELDFGKFLKGWGNMYIRNDHIKPRQFSRFKAIEGAFVSFGSRSHDGSGIIRDISSGGLSFEYIPVANSPNKISEIDIISDDQKVRIKKLPCKKIYELPIEDNNYTPVQMYQVGIQFRQIKHKQINKLVRFINDPT